jgi:hypothetical protein
MTWCAPLRRAQGFRVKLNSTGARRFLARTIIF